MHVHVFQIYLAPAHTLLGAAGSRCIHLVTLERNYWNAKDHLVGSRRTFCGEEFDLLSNIFDIL